MIFVTVGSQLKFDRLLKQVEKEIINGNIKEKVIVQCGKTKFKTDKMKMQPFFDMDEFIETIKKANLIITHGGVGSIQDALKYGKTVIATPRLSKYNEAVNDHQKEIIENFGKEKYLIPLLNLKDLNKSLKIAKTFKPKKYKSNTKNIIKLIEDFIESN